MNRLSRAIYTAGADDASTAHLFRARDDQLTWAVSHDREGRNLPAVQGGWRFERSFALGIREPMPVSATPEAVLRGLMANGFYMSREGSGPPGSSQ